MKLFIFGMLFSLLLVFLDVKFIQWIISILPEIGKWYKMVVAGIWIVNIWALWPLIALPSIIGWYYWYEQKNGKIFYSKKRGF